MLPDFIIAGTQKAGTTALQHYLTQHPDIFMAREECHYYDKFHHMGLSWYEEQFRKGNGKIVGEKTPGYMYHEDIPGRMYEDMPDVKLIFMLRNPVDRAYSEYWMVRLMGDEPYPFDKAVQQPHREYLSRGLYAQQISRFLECFSQDQMLFIISEDFRENGREWLDKIVEFLGATGHCGFEDLEEKHVGGHPRSEILLKLTNVPNFLKKRAAHPAAKLLLAYAVRFFRGINKTKGYPPMNPETRRQLEEYFRRPNEKLERIVGVDLSKWW